MYKCLYTDRIEIENEKLVRIVHAEYKGKKYKNELDVLKHTEDNINLCRNVFFSNLAGYGVVFPLEKDCYGYTYELEDFTLTLNEGKKEIPLYTNNKVSVKDMETIKTAYPTFYEDTKFHIFETNYELIKAIFYYKKNADDFIFLLKNKQTVMAYADAFYQLEESKKELIKHFISTEKISSYYSVKEILTLMKLKKDYPQYDVDSLYSLNKGDRGYWTNATEQQYEFYRQTKEYKSLSKKECKKIDALLDLNKSNTYIFSLSYAKLKNMIKQIRKYPKTEISFLYKLNYIFSSLSIKEKMKFYTTYNPEFKYVCKKYNFNNKNITTIDEAFTLWKKYTLEVEMLLSLQLDNIGLNEQYYLKDKDFKKRVIKVLKDEKSRTLAQKLNVNISELETVMKLYEYKLSQNAYDYIMSFKYIGRFCYYDKDQIEFLAKKRKTLDIDKYENYFSLLKNSNHDFNDKYWKIPGDFCKKYNRLLKEKKIIEKNKLEQKNKVYVDAIQKYIKDNPKLEIDGYEVFIPETIEDIKFQADQLKQCLISTDYPTKIINNNALLVFLRIDGKPIATCELDPRRKMEIVQFHQSQKDYLNCLATQEQKEVFNKWYEKSKLKELQVA